MNMAAANKTSPAAASPLPVSHKPYVQVVGALLEQARSVRILDAPCGSGWLPSLLRHDAIVDGVDLFAGVPPAGYRNFEAHDLDQGLPETGERYDAVVSCEGIEHFGNPGLFLGTAFESLEPGGLLIITTPNTWHPAARLQYLLRGFFPGFPSLSGKIVRGSHMHILPWSFPQLYTFMTLAGFGEVTIHDLRDQRPGRMHEWLLVWPQWLYCRHRGRRAGSAEERRFWRQAGGRQSLLGRRLVVSAVRPCAPT